MPKKKRIQTGQEDTGPAKSPLRAAANDDSEEVKDFVDNYLALADKALGFMRHRHNQLTVSTCVYCQHTIAASNLKLLAFAENLHVCPAKRPPSAPSEDEKA